MAGNFINIDTGFPTFTGSESEKERTTKMLNYLRQLVDELKYTLNNLEEKNFNRSGLDKIMEDGTEDIREQEEILAAQLQQTNASVSNLSSRVGNLEGLPARMTAAENNIADMQQDISDNATAISNNATAIGILNQTLTRLLSAVSVDASGNVHIGGSGIRVDVNGNVYINGTPQ